MSSAAKYGRYLLMAVLIAGFWFLNRHSPLWEEVVRTVAVFSVIMLLLRIRLRRRGVDVHLLPLIAGKAVLVVLAAVVEDVLRKHGVVHASMIVSVGLGLALFVAGAVFDRYLFTLSTQKAAPTG